MRAHSLVIASLALAAMASSADAECPAARGKPIYRQERGPIHPPEPGEPADVQTQTLAIYPGGRWTWVGAGEFDSGEAMGRGGCLAPAVMKEFTRALARARFRRVGGRTVATCQAVNTAKVTYAAPRRGAKVSVEVPCGIPLERTTAALAACAQVVTSGSTVGVSDVRASCRGELAE